ncbi:MAG: CopG family ribbon-helix-helix protein [Chthoniobacterales bacterium]|nr:CopG family ribbon-helix-helix protein [Chthoniobacterales bacterium]
MPTKRRLVRFSVSMPEELVSSLDKMVRDRKFPNRSHALASLIHSALTEDAATNPDSILMGVMTFIYPHNRPNLLSSITKIQHEFLKEIITIQLVHLEQEHSLQILLVQGHAETLRLLKNRFSALKGIKNTTLQLSSTLLPPIYSPS